MSASGAGRYACHSQGLVGDGSSEPRPNPLEAGVEAWLELPWIFKTDAEALLAQLRKKGMTICWDVVSDDGDG